MKIALNQKQMDFLKSKYINTGFVAGFGSGKSFVSTLKTIIKKVNYPNATVAYYLPTYGLIRDICFDKFPTMLSDMGYDFKLNKSDKEIHIKDMGKIIFRSMDTPENIVGYETFYTVVDECDILPMDKMTIAYDKIIGRNRQVVLVDDEDVLNKFTNTNIPPKGTYYHEKIEKLCYSNQMDIVGTPEGYKFFYKRYVTEFNSNTDLLIKASTYENKHLPITYIQGLEQQYPKQLLQAYLKGEFVNLTSGAVYFFDRNKHDTNLEHREDDYLIIGQDFNVGGCCSVVYIKDGLNMYAVDEFVSSDTFRLIDNLRERYPYNKIEIIPDASGKQGKTSASRSDLQLLMDAGYEVDAPNANPRVQDRINTTNNHYERGHLYINTKKCPQYARSQEQQAYNEKGEPEKFSGAATVDDWNDAGTYPIHRLFGLERPTFSSFNKSFG